MPEEEFKIAGRYGADSGAGSWAADDSAGIASGTALTREELAVTGPLALFEPDPDAHDPAVSSPCAPSRRAQVARVAGAIVAAGLAGWAAHGPIHTAGNSVRGSVPSPSATQRPSPPAHCPSLALPTLP